MRFSVRGSRGDGVVLAPLGSRADWEDTCAVFPEATAFHRYDFLESVAPALRCTFVPLQVLFKGQPAGVAPLLVKRLGPFCTINWVPFPYLGPLVPVPLIPATLSALRLEARRRHALNHQQSFAHAIADHQASGFTALKERTFVIPLTDRSDEDLLAAMRPKRRREIRRAQGAGFEICPAEADDFRLMDGWVSQVYAAQGLGAAYPAGTYGQIFGALKNAPGSVFRAARLGGRTVALDVAFATARRGFGWQAAVDPAHQPDCPQALLTWHMLLWARDMGAREFDLVGAPNDGIAAYKIRFGAQQRHYTVLHRQAGLHRTAFSAFSRLRS